MRKSFLSIIVLLPLFQFQACKEKEQNLPVSIPADRLESFEISNNRDTSLYTGDEIIIHVPKDAVVDGNGEFVEHYTMEFSSFLGAEYAIEAGLHTTFENRPLSSSAIVYANFEKEGEELFINPEKPLELEIPEYYDNDNLEVFAATSGADGELKWEKTNQSTYLATVEFDQLDFLPAFFAERVKEELATVYSRDAADSLYYFMGGYRDSEINTYYRVDHASRAGINFYQNQAEFDDSDTIEVATTPGIQPRHIKVLKTPPFQHTFIATKAFEARLKVLMRLCPHSPDAFITYLHNLHRPLWYSDSINFHQNLLDGNGKKTFQEFYERRQTNVADAPTSSESLLDYFLTEIEKEYKLQLDLANRHYRKKQRSIDKLLKKRNKLQAKRTSLLKKREKYRLKRFDFEMTKSGWYNFALEVRPQDLEKFDLDVKVQGGPLHGRAYAYIVNPRIFSLFALKSDDNTFFNRGFGDDPHLLLWKSQDILVVGVRVIDEDKAFAEMSAQLRDENHFILNLEKTEGKELRRRLRNLPLKKRENKIEADIELSEKIRKEDIAIAKELVIHDRWQKFMHDLYFLANKSEESDCAIFDEFVDKKP